MTKHNPNNERIKRKYLIFMKEARQQQEATIDAIAKAINRFENYTKFRDFKSFRFEQAVGFKKHLAKQDNKRTGDKLSKATLNSTLRQLKSFFNGCLCRRDINHASITLMLNILICQKMMFELPRQNVLNLFRQESR
ncbi:MAG: phage integrase N-terminal SAM-like domain-containing protein [Cycloclasticus sp.]|nr:phage integrase N-terminal SAM-like domain-containing protein [Cycloclasticus sp.]